MNFVTENITPAKAQEYLNTSVGNRPISKPTVHSYADTMKQGGWMLNGVPIVFDTEGHLLDGHHRLEAITMAGIPVKMDVCRGVAAEAFTTYDCGRHRSLGQLLAMQQVKNYNTVGSIVSVNETLVRSGKIWSNNHVGSAGRKRTNTESYELYTRDPKGYNKAAEEAVRLVHTARILNASWIGGIIYYLTHTGGYDHDYVLAFFESICSLDDGDIQPANLLRKRILREKLSNTMLTASQLFAFICIAWNAYITGKELKIIRFNDKIEEYPHLILSNE